MFFPLQYIEELIPAARRAGWWLLLAAVQAGAATVWTPTTGSGLCRAKAATNARPIRVTVADLSKCGIVNDSTIWTYGFINAGAVKNRSAANIHMEHAGDTGNLARVAKNVSGNSFDLYQTDGVTPVAGNGVWSHGGLVALVERRTTKPHPIIFADGADGVLTAGLQKSGPGGWYDAARIETIALDHNTGAATYLDQEHRDLEGRYASQAALRWYGEGKPAESKYRTDMRNALIHSPMLATAACSPEIIDCAVAPSLSIDYNWELFPPLKAFAYSLGRSELTPAERAALVANTFDDKEWSRGGYGYTGATAITPPLKAVSGVVSWKTGDLTVTGTGTAFTRQVAVGDFILLGGGTNYDQWYPVASIADDVTLTVAFPLAQDFGPTPTRLPYKVGAPWAKGHLGWTAYGFNTFYNLLCTADILGDLACPDHFVRAGGGLDVWQNHTIGRISRAMQVALAYADDDPRAGWLFTNASMIWYHVVRPHTANYGGLAASSNQYMVGRIWPQTLEPYGLFRFSFVGDPDMANGDDSLWKAAAAYQLGAIQPGTENLFFQSGGEAGGFPAYGTSWQGGFPVMLFRPDLDEAAELKHAFQHWSAYTAQELQGGGGFVLADAYLATRPDVTAVARPNTTLLMTYNTAPLAPADGVIHFDEPKIGMSSRSGWADTDVALWFNAASGSNRDHANREPGPWYAIASKGVLLYGGDDGDYRMGAATSVAGSPVFTISSDANTRTNEVAKTLVNAQYGSRELAVLSVDMTSFYKANVTSAQRTLIHAKAGPGHGYILDRIDAASPSSQAMTQYHHYSLAGCGTPNATDCIAFTPGSPGGSLTNKQPGVELTSVFYGGVSDTDDGNAAHGGYAGSKNNTFRVKLTAAGKAISLYTIHRTSTGGAAGMPAIKRSVSASHEVFEIADPLAPVVFFSAPGAVKSLKSATAVTTHKGKAQVVVTGLAAGSYAVKVDGEPAPGCGSMTVRAGEHVLACPAAGSGTVTVTWLGAPPAATTTTDSRIRAVKH